MWKKGNIILSFPSDFYETRFVKTWHVWPFLRCYLPSRRQGREWWDLSGQVLDILYYRGLMILYRRRIGETGDGWKWIRRLFGTVEDVQGLIHRGRLSIKKVSCDPAWSSRDESKSLVRCGLNPVPNVDIVSTGFVSMCFIKTKPRGLAMVTR
jgi:hypothetical protein